MRWILLPGRRLGIGEKELAGFAGGRVWGLCHLCFWGVVEWWWMGDAEFLISVRYGGCGLAS